MSQIFVPGPAQFFVGTGSAGALEFLGTSQNGASITYRRGQEPFIADVGGPTIPFDIQNMGVEAFIRCELALFNFDIYTKTIPNLLATTFGAVGSGEIGSPILQSSSYHRLLVYWPYVGTPYPNMVAARNFPYAFIMDHTEPVSTRGQVIPLVWHALPKLSTSAGTGTLVNTSTTGKGSAD